MTPPHKTEKFNNPSKLTRIGVFYDGNFFIHVSNYYKYEHSIRSRISISGLHEFIRHYVGQQEGVEARYCQIVDAHFFRGRFSAPQAEAQQKLYADRVLDDILMGEGVVTHYLPIRGPGEKGVDVWLALEAYELAVYKQFDVLVLIAGDSDFVPLARKVNSLGTRVMILGWDFDFTDQSGQHRSTITSSNLLDEVTYPVGMHKIIDDNSNRTEPLIRGLFVENRSTIIEAALPKNPVSPIDDMPSPPAPRTIDIEASSTHTGVICSIKNGYGFIKCLAYPDNIFFTWDELFNREFSELIVGDHVTFEEGVNDQGKSMAVKIVVLED